MRKRSEYSHLLLRERHRVNRVVLLEETVIHNTFIRIAYIYNAIKFIVWRWAKYLQMKMEKRGREIAKDGEDCE